MAIFKLRKYKEKKVWLLPCIGDGEVVPLLDVVLAGGRIADDPPLVREGSRTGVVVDDATVDDPPNLKIKLFCRHESTVFRETAGAPIF